MIEHGEACPRMGDNLAVPHTQVSAPPEDSGASNYAMLAPIAFGYKRSRVSDFLVPE